LGSFQVNQQTSFTILNKPTPKPQKKDKEAKERESLSKMSIRKRKRGSRSREKDDLHWQRAELKEGDGD